MNHSPNPEQNLIRALQHDDEQALYEMTRLYKGLARAIIAWLSPQDADEVFQATLLKAWNKRRLYNPKRGSFKSWFFTIYRNNAIDVLRQQKRQQESLEREALLRQDPDFLKLRHCVAKLLRDKPKTLSPLKWKILLADIDSFPSKASPSRLAELLQSTESSIRAQRSKTYQKLSELAFPDLRQLRKMELPRPETSGELQ